MSTSSGRSRLVLGGFSGLICVLACAAVAWGEDSGGYRGPTANGTYNASGLARKWPDGGPPLLWKFRQGVGWAAPSVSNGTVYISGGSYGMLYALTLDGQLKDRYAIGAMDWKRFTGTRTVPIVRDGVAVCSSPSANIVGIDLEKAAARWQVNAWKDFGSGKGGMGWGYPESPMLIGNKVIFNVCSRDDKTPPIVAIDIATGKTVWEMSPGTDKKYSAADTSGSWAMHGGRPLVFMPTWRYLVCLDGRDGKLQWEIASTSEKTLPPVYSEGYLLWPNGAKYQMIKLAADGKSYTKLWERPGAGFSGAAVVGNRVFMFGANKESAIQCDANGEFIEKKDDAGAKPKPAAAPASKESLLCVDRETGALLQDRPGPGAGHIIAADGLVFVVETGPVVSLLEPCPSGFEQRGSFKPKIEPGDNVAAMSDNKWIAPAVAEGRLFLRYGALHVYDIRIEPDIRGWRNDGTGKWAGNPPVQWSRKTNVRWEAAAGGAGQSAPVVADGKVYVTAAPASIACLDANDGKLLWQKEEKVLASAGTAQATFCPIVRKDRVFAVLGGSLAACYDTAGAKKWAVPLEAGAAAAPALIGEALLVPGKDLVSLDTQTGKQRWRTAPPAGRSAATPAVTWLRGVALAITSWGDIVTAEDGQVLAKGLADADAVLRGGRNVYFTGGKGDLAVTAYEMPETVVEPLKPRPLWKVALKGMAAPVSIVPEGEWLYILSAGGELAVLAAADGTELSRRSLGKLTGGAAPVLTMAGGKLYAGAFGDRAATLVLSAGANPARLWEYAAAEPAAEPAFDQDRQYVRAGKRLWCIGGKTPGEPQAAIVTELAPPAELAKHDAAEPIKSDVMCGGWVFLGPFEPDTAEKDFLAAVGGAGKQFPRKGESLKVDDRTLTWTALTDANYWTDARHSAGYRCVDISSILRRKDHTTAYVFAVVEAEADRIVRFEPHLPGMRWNDFGKTLKGVCWVDGRPTEPNAKLLLKKGRHCIMVQAGMGELPNTWGKTWVVPRFIDIGDEVAAARKKYEQDLALWQEYAKTKDALLVLGG